MVHNNHWENRNERCSKVTGRKTWETEEENALKRTTLNVCYLPTSPLLLWWLLLASFASCSTLLHECSLELVSDLDGIRNIWQFNSHLFSHVIFPLSMKWTKRWTTTKRSSKTTENPQFFTLSYTIDTDVTCISSLILCYITTNEKFNPIPRHVI